MKARRGGPAVLLLVMVAAIYNVMRHIWKILLNCFRGYKRAAVGVVHVQHNAFCAAPVIFAAYVVSKSTGYMVKCDGLQQVVKCVYSPVVGVTGVRLVSARLGAG